MNVLALEPYLGGSHQAFIEGWREHSRHHWTILGLPAYKWKWRMRHAAVTLAQQVAACDRDGQRWDVVWASDMLNLAEFLGLAPQRVRELPRVAYFHENQLTYPCQRHDDRDLHFAFTNFTTALAADQAWFNSAFHQSEFLGALRIYLARMPDFQPSVQVDRIAQQSAVQYPGIHTCPRRAKRTAGPLRVLWNARWEHDKNPEVFFEALRILMSHGTQFRLSVLGQSFGHVPRVFAWAREHFTSLVDHWGYIESRHEYLMTLLRADVVVSTAEHEFFGIGVVEAVAAGVLPLLPARLAYPEVVGQACPEVERANEFLYDGSLQQLVSRLRGLANDVQHESGWTAAVHSFQQATQARFGWTHRAAAMDMALEELVRK